MSVASFRRGVRAAVRGLWSGGLSRAQFNSSLSTVIKGELTSAWVEGARECGITAEELTEAELKARDAFIKEQQGYVSNFGGDIRDVDKLSKGKLTPLFERAEMWIGRYEQAKANGHAMACLDEKQEFELGPTSDHCRTCVSLNGKVFRNSTWIKYSAVPPRNPRYECKGFRCQCRLKPTKRRVSRGGFPVGLLN